MLRASLLGFSLAFVAISGYTDASTAYVADFDNSMIFRIDLINGGISTVTTIPGANLNTTSLASSTTAYTVGYTSNSVYSVNLTNGNFSTLTTIPGASLSNILVANNTTALATGFVSQDLYLINLANGSFSTVATLTGNPNDIAIPFSIENSLTTAYVIGNASGDIYRVDLTNGSYTTVATGVGVNPTSFALANNTIAYATAGPNIYSVNLNNGAVSLVTTIPGTIQDGIAMSTSTTAYTVDMDTGDIYFVNLTNGSFSQVSNPLPGTNNHDIELVLQVGTGNLSGNNLKFAKYLNNNAFLVVPLFALQPDVAKALQSAIPTRNAISTFASQTTQMTFGQTVYNHLVHKRLARRQSRDTMIAHHSQTAPRRSPVNQYGAGRMSGAANFGKGQNLTVAGTADAETSDLASLLRQTHTDDSDHPSDDQHRTCVPVCCKKESIFSPWLGAFGEFAREKAQHQTPAFQNTSFGFVAALDYYKNDTSTSPLVGGGFAYAHTHIHEEDDAGHANLNQGAIVLYAAQNYCEWNFDLGLWGGYYHTDNTRKIVLPGIGSAHAESKIHGWQLTPHFGFGYTYTQDWFSVEPFETIDWVVCWESGFSEHGAGVLNMGQNSRTCSLCRNELGLRFEEILTYCWGTIAFQEKGSYVYQKTFHTGVISAFLLGAPGSFTVSTLTGAQNLGVVEFNALFTPYEIKYPYGSISYQGEFGSRYQAHRGILTIGLDY